MDSVMIDKKAFSFTSMPFCKIHTLPLYCMTLLYGMAVQYDNSWLFGYNHAHMGRANKNCCAICPILSIQSYIQDPMENSELRVVGAVYFTK